MCETYENEIDKLNYIHGYIINIINNRIPRYNYCKPKNSKRIIKKYLLDNKYDEDFVEEINNDFCEGFGCATDLILSEFICDIQRKQDILKLERIHEYSN